MPSPSQLRSQIAVTRDADRPRGQGHMVDDEDMHRRMVATATRSPLLKSAGTLAGGAAVGQAVTALSALVLARLYLPSEIGAFGLFLSFSYLASMALSLRYEQAIVVPSSDVDAARLVRLGLYLVPALSLVAGGILLALVATDALGFGLLPPYAPALAVVVLLVSGVIGVLRFWLIRAARFRSLAGLAIQQSLGRAMSQIAFGFAGFGLVGLLIGDVIGRCVGLRHVVREAASALRQRLAEPGPSLGQVARRYARFPVAGVPSSLLNGLAAAAPVPIVAGLFGLPAAGFLAFVQRAYGLPMTVIGGSVADAVLSRMAHEVRTDPAAPRRLFVRVALVLFLLGLPLTVAVIVLGPTVIEWLVGPEWRTAGLIAAVVAPWYLAAFIVSPLSRVVILYERQALKLLYDIATVMVMAGTLALASASGLALLDTLTVMTFGQVGAYTVYVGLLYGIVHVGSKRPIHAAR